MRERERENSNDETVHELVSWYGKINSAWNVRQAVTRLIEKNVCCDGYSYERLEFSLTSELVEYDVLNRNTGNKQWKTVPKGAGLTGWKHDKVKEEQLYEQNLTRPLNVWGFFILKKSKKLKRKQTLHTHRRE